MALVVVALSESKVFIVVEPVERKPPRKAMIVEVDCSFVPSLVNGQAKLLAPPHPVQVVTVRLPILAVLARRSVVEARPET